MIAFSIGNIHIYWYGIFYAISFLIWYFFLNFLGRSFPGRSNFRHLYGELNWPEGELKPSWKKYFSHYPKIQNILSNPENLIFYVVLGVLIWWRIWYFWRWGDNFFESLIQLPQIRNGWMAFLGWAIWVVIAMYIFSKKNKLDWKQFLILMDIILLIVPIWIMLGRIWNHLNQEIQGLWVSQVSTIIANLFWSFWLVESWKLNVALAWSILEWALIAIILQLIFWTRYIKNIQPWLISWVFLILYGLARLFLEPLKQYSYTTSWKLWLGQAILISIIILWVYLIYVSSFWNKSTLKTDKKNTSKDL